MRLKQFTLKAVKATMSTKRTKRTKRTTSTKEEAHGQLRVVAHHQHVRQRHCIEGKKKFSRFRIFGSFGSFGKKTFFVRPTRDAKFVANVLRSAPPFSTAVSAF